MTMAQAELNDGQRLLAVNDLFVGARTHVSARYRLRHEGREEDQSSSGLIVSTGAGSTGWYRSILTGAAGIVQAHADIARGPGRQGPLPDSLGRAPPRLQRPRAVHQQDLGRRRSSTARSAEDRPLEIISRMPQNGVIFSDGVEEDRLDFNSGAVARIGLADRTLCLVVPKESENHQGRGRLNHQGHQGHQELNEEQDRAEIEPPRTPRAPRMK